MIDSNRSAEAGTEALIWPLLASIAARDEQAVARQLHAHPELASSVLTKSSFDAGMTSVFFKEIGHDAHAGDTPLHISAAAYSTDAARRLVALGADVRAVNRHGASPLHYAADGAPGSLNWRPASQKAVIRFLIAAGARPDAVDKRGVAPLHRAVRTRCSGAVNALLSGGADPRLRNANGSTPLHLAVQNTGRAGTTSMAARYQQRQIIALLLKYGASPDDVNAAGRTVRQCSRSDWLADLLDGFRSQ